MTDGQPMRFAAHDEMAPEAADQNRLNCLAAAIANQQRAGFKDYLDTREMHCACCQASGFNTGWGFWEFSCGMTILSDGEQDEPCPHEEDKAA